MFRFSSSRARSAALASFSCLAAAPAVALSPVSFVSGKGADTGNCASPANPCRTFQYAHNQTSPGGEINALDPANYWPMTINRSISVKGVEGAGITRQSAGDAITINAGATDVISLSGLTLNGFNKLVTNGVVFNSGGSLTIRQCVVKNYAQDGIRLFPTGATKFIIADVIASDNGQNGIEIFPQGPLGSASGAIEHVTAHMNAIGILLQGSTRATSVDSVATNNTSFGFSAEAGTFLRLTHSVSTRNGVGVSVNGSAETAGNNYLHGNINSDNIAGSGTLTLGGTQ